MTQDILQSVLLGCVLSIFAHRNGKFNTYQILFALIWTIAVIGLKVIYGGNQITFYSNDQQNQLKILTKRETICLNFSFHVFVTPTNFLSGDDKYLTREDLIALSDIPGAIISAHGFSHQHLSALSPAEIEKELKSSNNWLEDVTGKTITTMSYPHGAFNPQIEEIAAAVGYLYAATSNWGTYNVGENPLQIPRIDVWNLDNEKSLKQKLDGNWDWMRRFI